MSFNRPWLAAHLRVGTAIAALILMTACGAVNNSTDVPPSGLNPSFVSKAIHEATHLQKIGSRVWCVPFARNASGIELRGNAETWWGKAKGVYDRGNRPMVGAVMAFSDTRRNPMGHLAVVSQILSEREIKIHHANWHRNKVSLDMTVIDVSDANDWSRVKVETYPGSFGRVYPIDGFISRPASSGA